MDEAQRASLLGSHRDRAAAETTLRTIVARPLGVEVAETCVEANLSTSVEAWTWWLSRGSREDLSAEVGGLAVPALIVVGAQDPVISEAVAERELRAAFTEGRLVRIDGAGHLLPLEAPDQVSDLIRAFSRSV